MTSFGQILNSLLAENNIRKAAFARSINVPAGRLAGILSGRRLPDGELLGRMTAALETDAVGCMLLLESYKVAQTLTAPAPQLLRQYSACVFLNSEGVTPM